MKINYDKIIYYFKKYLPYLTIGLIIVVAIFQVIAIFRLPALGDEPHDFSVIANDFRQISFFQDIFSYDQSRLPFFISAPFLFYGGEKALILLRILFLTFHFFYLYFSFKIVKLISSSSIAGWLYVLLISTSCYLSSFSIFTISTSDNLFLLFYIIVIYYFLKSFIEFKRTGVFRNYLILALLLSLCIASKLFGVILLLSLFVFSLFYFGKKIYIEAQWKKILFIDIFFLASLLIINLSNLSLLIKLVLSGIISLLFLLGILILISRERRCISKRISVSLLCFWSLIIFTAFNLTLIFSPIYLNLDNFLKVFGWADKWGWAGGQLTANSNFYDILVIVLVKFGFISIFLSALLYFVILRLYPEVRKKIKEPHYIFFITIIFFHILIISIPKHKVTWWPLAIFPFLYLPLILAFNFIRKTTNKKLLAIAMLILSLVVFDNLSRYFYWFPYSHFDGAQYGRNFIGYNRPGFISFETGGQLLEYARTFPKDKDIKVNIQLSRVPQYNAWIEGMSVEKLKKEGINNIVLSDELLNNDNINDYNFIVTSNIADNYIEKQLEGKNITKVKTVKIKNIEVANIWRNDNK